MVHGLWMRPWVMGLLSHRLHRCGFAVVPFAYPSVRQPMDRHVERLQALVADLEAPVVHFLGHSLGGRVILRLFQRHPQQRPGRILTLATPLQPSASAAALQTTAWGRWFGGCSLAELTGPAAPLPADREVAMLAGDLSAGMGRFITDLPRPNDGAVAVVETRHPGLCQHRILRVSHSGILLSPAAAASACRFLRSGRLDSSGEG